MCTPTRNEYNELKSRLANAYSELEYAYSLLINEQAYPDILEEIREKLDYAVIVFRHDLKIIGIPIEED